MEKAPQPQQENQQEKESKEKVFSIQEIKNAVTELLKEKVDAIKSLEIISRGDTIELDTDVTAKGKDVGISATLKSENGKIVVANHDLRAGMMVKIMAGGFISQALEQASEKIKSFVEEKESRQVKELEIKNDALVATFAEEKPQEQDFGDIDRVLQEDTPIPNVPYRNEETGGVEDGPKVPSGENERIKTLKQKILDANERPVIPPEPKPLVDQYERPLTPPEPKPLVDKQGVPFSENNPPARSPKEFSPEKVNIERKRKQEPKANLSELKALKAKVAELNERYLREPQREEKALLYSQLEEAQKAYRKMEEALDTAPQLSERDRKINRLDELRKLIRELNERYQREPQREEKALLYSQLEKAQKEAEALEKEIDEMSSQEKPKDTPGGGKEGYDHPPTHIPSGTFNTPDDSDNKDALQLVGPRDRYLKAKRLRGNIVRGWFGRLFRRKMDSVSGNEEVDLGGKQGKEDLEEFRREYQEGLSRYMTAEIGKLQARLSAELASGTKTADQCNTEMKAKIVDLLSEEQRNIDQRSTLGIEKNRLEKLKTGFRQRVLKRLGVSLTVGGLVGGAVILTGGTAIAGGAMVAKSLVGGATYFGVESGWERFSKLFGHKGLVNEISKAQNFTTDEALEKYIATLPPEDIKKEAARLKMLQVEKGVAIDQLNTKGDTQGWIANHIIKREQKITAEELTNGPAGVETFADTLSAKLATEINAQNEIVESEVDKERKKKMFRKITAIISGGWVSGSLFNPETTFAAPPEINVPPNLTPPSPLLPDFTHTVGSGENLWNIIESAPSVSSTTAGLGAEAETHFVDALKDIYEGMTPAELNARGFGSGVVDNLNPGEVLNLREITNPGILSRALANANGLSPTEITSIMNNNSEIATWLADPTNRASLTGALNSATIDKILAGTI